MGCFLYTEQLRIESFICLRTVTFICGVKLEKKSVVSFVLKKQHYRFVVMQNSTHITIG